MKNINITCKNFFNVGASNSKANPDAYQYKLSAFNFENLKITAKENLEIDTTIVDNFKLKNIVINGKKVF